MKGQHLMIDLETLSTKPNAIVLSIGLVYFTEEGIQEKFYINLDMKQQLEGGRDLDRDTFYWWLSQSSEAGKVLGAAIYEVRVGLHSMLHWIINTCQIELNTVNVWGNGAGFDNVILLSLIEQYLGESRKVWKFWNDRCFRTYMATNDIERVKPEVAHNAIHDAEAQAQTLINHWSKPDASVGA